jgi:hypothetical protein
VVDGGDNGDGNVDRKFPRLQVEAFSSLDHGELNLFPTCKVMRLCC